MAKINMDRVILGGLFAGLIINIGEFFLNNVLLATLWETTLRSLNRPPMGEETAVFFIVLGFFLGIVAVWIYAAIRTRFGPGPMTAICAGLVVWSLAYFYSAASSLPLHLFPTRLLFYGAAWGFVELPLACMAGAWIYREKD